MDLAYYAIFLHEAVTWNVVDDLTKAIVYAFSVAIWVASYGFVVISWSVLCNCVLIVFVGFLY